MRKLEKCIFKNLFFLAFAAGLTSCTWPTTVLKTDQERSSKSEDRWLDTLLKQFKTSEQAKVVSAYTAQPLVDKLNSKIAIPNRMRESHEFVVQMDQCYSL